MKNPYAILEIKETASDIDIKNALKKQVELYCGYNESKKNADGEYLKEMFVNAARDLLSPIKRNEIDRELAYNRKRNALKVCCEEKNTNDTINNKLGSVEQNKIDKFIKEEGELKDVTNVEICVYDNDCIGLFRKIEWFDTYSSIIKDSGIIYVGIDSSKIGMKKLFDFGYCENKFINPGEIWEVNNKKYLANCKISKTISFDDMRFKLYRSGIVGPYTMGYATASEMLDVMNYAANYFEIEKINLKNK